MSFAAYEESRVAVKTLLREPARSVAPTRSSTTTSPWGRKIYTCVIIRDRAGPPKPIVALRALHKPLSVRIATPVKVP